MEYLNKVLGIKTTYTNETIKHLPNYIIGRYTYKTVLLDSIKTVFVYPIGDIEQINSLKKHLDKIQECCDCFVVLVLKKISSRQKVLLLKEHISFIVDNKQIYLPFLGTYLQERCDSEKKQYEKLLPSAQLLLLNFIYNGTKDLTTSKAAKQLCLTPTSLSRASNQLEDFDLINTSKNGVNKMLHSDKQPKELFNATIDILESPVKRTIYVSKELIDNNLLKCGLSALSRYSMISDSNVECYATDSISNIEKQSTNYLYDPNSQVEIQLWRYDPKKLSNSDVVDELSLALAYKDNGDERIQEAVEEMLKKVWRKIDGNRD